MDEATRASRRRELAAELRRLRALSGLSTTDLASLIGSSQAKVSRLENAKVGASAKDVRAWAVATEHPDLAEPLAERAAALQSIANDWDDVLGTSMAARQAEVAEVEAAATHARFFTGAIIPGLFQAPSYARAIISTMRQADPAQIDAWVSARMNRQAILHRPAKTWTFLIGELALQYRPASPDPGMWRSQAERLLLLAGFPTVDVLILPGHNGWPVLPSAAWSLYDLPEDDRYAMIEEPEGEKIYGPGDEFDWYAARFDDLAALAVSGASAIERINESLT